MKRDTPRASCHIIRGIALIMCTLVHGYRVRCHPWLLCTLIHGFLCTLIRACYAAIALVHTGPQGLVV